MGRTPNRLEGGSKLELSYTDKSVVRISDNGQRRQKNAWRWAELQSVGGSGGNQSLADSAPISVGEVKGRDGC